jgi:hypothetical protein
MRLTWGGNELDEPSQPEQTNAKYDEATDESECHSNLFRRPLVGMRAFDMFDNLRHSQ